MSLPVSTFSIVARDPATGDLGIAVQSKFLGVGSVVPWARAGAGAVATQSWANPAYGPAGLELLAGGRSAAEALDELIQGDEGRDFRQAGIVDAAGRSAGFTGSKCMPWAGGVTGENFAAQGNILTGPEVVEAMAAAIASSPGDLASRLVAALAAGQAAGGDSRGKQSAALLVVRPAGGYLGLTDVMIDLRVDDHPEPIVELERLLGLWRMYFEKPKETVPLAGPLRAEVAGHLRTLGYLAGDDSGAAFRKALFQWFGTENFEERDVTDQGLMDVEVLAFMRHQAGSRR